MNINLSDDFVERIKAHLKETENPQPLDFFIEECVDYCIEYYPWSHGDICVHNDECMHCKTVEDWRNEK